NTTYYYKVQAVNSSGASSDSSIVYATSINNGGLSVPTSLTATVANANQINLTWNPVSNATYYYVYRATSYSGTYTIVAVPTTTSYIDSSLTLNTTYYYKIQAVNSSGASSDSSIAYATTNVNGALLAPTNFIATAANTNQINLTWNAISNATYYYVYRATSPSDNFTNIATITTANYSDSGLSPNTTYYYKVQALSSSGLSAFSSIVNATTVRLDNTAPSNPTSQTQYDRLAGNDMYETSAEVAKAWPTSYYAIIVSGENFSDALCSSPLAQKYNAPLLLTTKDTLNEQTKNQLTRLRVKTVILIGGTGVISSVVEQSIKNMGIEVSRIAGSDKYETSVKIAQAMGQFGQAVIASGETFPDALSIAPIAAVKGIPILLTPKDTLPASVKTYLLKNIQSTYVVGGTGVVSDTVFKQLPSPKRLNGVNRYETNISIIKEFENELKFDICYVSTGENYADALAGSSLAALSNSPVILVSDPIDPSTIAFFRNKGGIKKKVVFGGIAVVPESILTAINGASNGAVGGSNTPSTPGNISATSVSSSQINLTWDSVSGATSYYIYGSTSSAGTYSQIATTTTTIYLNTGLWADTTYYYKVKAVNSAGSSSYSPTANAKTASSDY
ncbi:cell wall-binding repeat-containing protein, partial [Desulfosporosinus sp. I2]|uniref:cell wall-binding repeat-containing protein n=1 Tax=Desulfosporosinus sp. I2 TaxID=1617025 RepID=UPI0005F009B2